MTGTGHQPTAPDPEQAGRDPRTPAGDPVAGEQSGFQVGHEPVHNGGDHTGEPLAEGRDPLAHDSDPLAERRDPLTHGTEQPAHESDPDDPTAGDPTLRPGGPGLDATPPHQPVTHDAAAREADAEDPFAGGVHRENPEHLEGQ